MQNSGAHAPAVSSLELYALAIALLIVLIFSGILLSMATRLRREKVLMRELFDQAPVAITLLNGESRVVRVNRHFTRMFGYQGEEAEGRLLAELIPAAGTGGGPDEIEQPPMRGQLLEREELRQRKDGTRVHVQLVSAPFSVPGRGTGIYAIYQDITGRKEAEAHLQMLSGQLLRREDEQRRAVAQELHDTTAQLLVALNMNLAVINESSADLTPRARRAIAESIDLSDQCLGEVRTVSYLLHPLELRELGLQGALAGYVEGFVQRSGIRVSLDIDPPMERLPDEVETAVFRIVQECLTNIHRHSRSRVAAIELRPVGANIVLRVKDAGQGIQRGETYGVGIASMKERVKQLHGSLELLSSQEGTEVRATIPLPDGPK